MDMRPFANLSLGEAYLYAKSRFDSDLDDAQRQIWNTSKVVR